MLSRLLTTRRVTTSFFVSAVFCTPLLATNPLTEFWMELDAPHPFCERTVKLDISSDAFFPIANEVPEREAFNDLISTFRAREWAKLDVDIREFFFKYEKTPLRQVVEFLKVFSLYERLNQTDEAAEKQADYGLRQALLLYPKSKLSPIAYAAAGQYLLRSDQLQRALELYRTARSNYPESEFSCVLDLGILEGSFLLREWKEMEETGKTILEKCNNFRILAVTKLRLGEAAVLKGEPDGRQKLEAAVSADSPFAERFVSTSLYDLGELYYRDKKYRESEHYFERYLKATRHDMVCGARAQKRQADIAFRTGLENSVTTGRYLEVYDRYPKTDEGRFSKAHALFISADFLQKNELERRFKWVESQVDSIEEETLRFRVYLEKGIVQWLAGDPSALDYLERLQHRRVVDLRQGAVGTLIRSQLVKFWTDRPVADVETAADGQKVLRKFEKDFDFWMKGFDREIWAEVEYGKLTTGIFGMTLLKDPAGALDLLESWRKSEFFPTKTALDPRARKNVAEALLAWQLDNPKQSGVMILSRKEALNTLLGSTYAAITELANSIVVPGEVRAPGGERKPLTLAKDASENLRLATAQVWIAQGDYKSARKTLLGLLKSPRRQLAEDELLNLDLKEEKWAAAFERYRGKLNEKSPAEANRKWLDAMAQLCRQRELPDASVQLPGLAKRYLPTENLHNELRMVSAAAWLKRGKVDKAIGDLEMALSSKLDEPTTAEARFKLGQALWKNKQSDAARDQWQKVLQLKDPTWAPLAQNELKLAVSNVPTNGK